MTNRPVQKQNLNETQSKEGTLGRNQSQKRSTFSSSEASGASRHKVSSRMFVGRTKTSRSVILKVRILLVMSCREAVNTRGGPLFSILCRVDRARRTHTTQSVETLQSALQYQKGPHKDVHSTNLLQSHPAREEASASTSTAIIKSEEWMYIVNRGASAQRMEIASLTPNGKGLH